jgi:pyruvate/2-oxoglutarate dehydrogenase complex dihydrolipoamide dehydrogenase (E3) component
MTDSRMLEGVDPELLESLQPFDNPNQALLDNVHPPQWINPEPRERYHLVVLGAGTAGLVSAAGAAGLGARVALVERRLMGGDCLNYGCVPSKAMISAARAWHEARTAAARFGGPQVAGDGDFGAVMRRMRELRAGISHHDSADRFRSLGIDVFIGEGSFVSGDAIEVAGNRLRFRRAIIATGARPLIPPISGCDHRLVLTNETVFSLTDLPPRFGVIGGGPIGCELAQTFARLGSQVCLFEMAPHILGREDSDAAAIVERAMGRDGIDLQLGAKVHEVEITNEDKVIHFEREGRSARFGVDEVLLAIGRSPNVEGIGLEAAGVEFDRSGIVVDDRLRTSNGRIYAVGDVASQYKFTHAADALARIAIQNSLFFGRAKASDLVIPWCTYTSPELAHVGLSQEDAEKNGIGVDVLTVPLDQVDRAVLDGTDEGFLRLVIQRGKDRILGATLVADHAGELLGELTLAVKAGVGLNTIAATIHAYPTQAEVLKKAADSWRRGKLTPTVQKIFNGFFRLFS